MPLNTDTAMDLVFSFISTIFTSIVKVLVEQVFFEVIWSGLLVHLFITMTSAWGFIICIVVFLWFFNKKFIEGVRG